MTAPRIPVPSEEGSRAATDAPPDGRFLSRDACAALLRRAAGATTGGTTAMYLNSRWKGNIRWARNRIISSGDVRDNSIRVVRGMRGAQGSSETNRIDDVHIDATAHRAERYMMLEGQRSASEIFGQFYEPYSQPKIWSDATYRQRAAERAELMHRLSGPAAKAGVLSAGYIQVSAHGRSSANEDQLWYYPHTVAQYTVTVRDPKTQGSGWAGTDNHDWSAIDAEAISAIALDKCLRSRNPVRAEPGRYTVILEPQAVCHLVANMFSRLALSRVTTEITGGPYNAGRNQSKLGQRVIDERLSVVMDNTDPTIAFPPFSGWRVFHPAMWVKDGVLTDLWYDREYAVKQMGLDTGGNYTLGSFKMTGRGPATPIEEMIATTKRGVLVTRFWGGRIVDEASGLVEGYTRDGTWLVENGKISKAIKNFRFIDSPLFVLNQIDQIGPVQRVFNVPADDEFAGYTPVMVPAIKARDFNFVSLTDAV